MSEARVNNLSNESNSGGPTISGITTFSSPYFFVPPVGNTAERPDNPQLGDLRFNTDRGGLEYFRGDTIGWAEVEATNEELDGGTRGLILGGGTPSESDVIDYHNLSSPGTFADFGNLFSGRYGLASTSSRVRAVCFGGYGSNNDTVDYITMASLGNSVDALNLPVNHKYPAAWSNGTRGCVAGSYYPAQINTISYVDIATLGSSADFGDLTEARGIMKAANSTTRGIIGGGFNDSDAPSLTIDYVNTASTGNALDFGDCISATNQANGCPSNAVRALFGGAYNNAIGYITMATLGNALDFGDNVTAYGHRPGMSSSTRGLWGGGKGGSPAASQTAVDYVEIMSTGNGKDFGDLSVARQAGGGTSNGHGGL